MDGNKIDPEYSLQFNRTQSNLSKLNRQEEIQTESASTAKKAEEAVPAEISKPSQENAEDNKLRWRTLGQFGPLRFVFNLKSLFKININNIYVLSDKTQQADLIDEVKSKIDSQEQAADQAPESNTVYNFSNIDNFNGTVVNAGDNASVINSPITPREIENVNDLVGLIDRNIKEAGLGDEAKAIVDKEIQAVNEEMTKEKPQRSVIKNSFSVIKRVLEGASGNLAAQAILTVIEKIF